MMCYKRHSMIEVFLSFCWGLDRELTPGQITQQVSGKGRIESRVPPQPVPRNLSYGFTATASHAHFLTPVSVF